MKNSIAKIVDFVKRHRDRMWRGFVLVLIAWSGYNVGIISGRHGAVPAQEAALFQPRTAIVSQAPVITGQGTRSTNSARTSDTRVVVSKSSTSKKYHHPWCLGANQIKESNRLWYPTADAARQAGYSLAGNCTE